MDMHHVGEFAELGAFAHQHTDLLYDICSMGTVGMTAEDGASPIPSKRRGDKELQHALGLTHREGLAIGPPEGFLADVRCTRSFKLIFRWPDTGRLGLREDGGWHDVEADTITLSQNMIDSPNSLHLSGMGKHLTTIAVADGVDRETRRQGVRETGFNSEGIGINGDGAVGGKLNAKRVQTNSAMMGAMISLPSFSANFAIRWEMEGAV